MMLNLLLLGASTDLKTQVAAKKKEKKKALNKVCAWGGNTFALSTEMKMGWKNSGTEKRALSGVCGFFYPSPLPSWDSQYSRQTSAV